MRGTLPVDVAVRSYLSLNGTFLLCWVLPAIVLFYLPLPAGMTVWQHNLVVYFCIGVYLLLASFLARTVMVRVFEGDNREILLWVCFSVGLFVLLYGYVRIFEDINIVVASLATANLLLLASVIGTALSSAVTRVAELVPICITAAVADVVSVVSGPTRVMIESLSTYYAEGMVGVPPLVDFIVIKVGIPGFDVPMPLFGVTDWIFLVLISSAMLRVHESDNLFGNWQISGRLIYFPVTAAALFTGLVFAQVLDRFVPAMVFISSIVLIFLMTKLRVYKKIRKSDILFSLAFPATVVAVIFLFQV